MANDKLTVYVGILSYHVVEVDGGWMRIGSIKNGDRCPTGWLQMTSPVKAYRGTSDKAGCYST